MKILKPGKVEMRKFVCLYCGCVLVADETEVDGSNRLRCPTCEANLYWVNGEPYEGSAPAQTACRNRKSRLAELLRDNPYVYLGKSEIVADYLIQRGVTFREDAR